jgi:hypothetical protein
MSFLSKNSSLARQRERESFRKKREREIRDVHPTVEKDCTKCGESTSPSSKVTQMQN